MAGFGGGRSASSLVASYFRLRATRRDGAVASNSRLVIVGVCFFEAMSVSGDVRFSYILDRSGSIVKQIIDTSSLRERWTRMSPSVRAQAFLGVHIDAPKSA